MTCMNRGLIGWEVFGEGLADAGTHSFFFDAMSVRRLFPHRTCNLVKWQVLLDKD